MREDLNLFKNKTQSIKTLKAQKGNKLIRVFNARLALRGEKRQALLERMQTLLTFSVPDYELYCQPLLEHLVDYYQDLPETRNSYFCERGGLIDHALSRTEAALSLCNAYFLSDTKQKELSKVQKLWLYALFSAALLQGIGKLMIDLDVDCFDEQGEYVKAWNPLLGSLYGGGTYYTYEFGPDAPDAFRQRLNALLARQLMPLEGFEWIASDKEVLATWLALLHEDHRGAGTLGPILIRADALAINRYLLEKKARDFAGESKKSRYGLLGSTFNVAVETGPQEVWDSSAGLEFIKWLTQALGEAKLMVNKAPLYMVPGGLLMSPEIFKYFVREHPQFKNWMAVQESFLTMKIHAAGSEGQSVQRFEQSRTQLVASGTVLANYALVLPDKVSVVNPSNGAIKQLSAMDMINAADKYTGFITQKQAASTKPLQHLSAEGQWTSPTSRVSPSSKKTST